MTQTIRLFVLIEAVSFLVAALIHSGVLLAGYEHPRARIAEGVITIVLFVGLALTWLRPARTRTVGLVVQGFALAGTLIGLFTVAIGVGPRTPPDLVYHVGILVLLIWGLIVTAQARPQQLGRHM